MISKEKFNSIWLAPFPSQQLIGNFKENLIMPI